LIQWQTGHEAHAKDAVRAAWLYVLKFLNYFNYRNELFVKAEASPLQHAVALLFGGFSLPVAALHLILAREWPLMRLERFALLLDVLNAAHATSIFLRI